MIQIKICAESHELRQGLAGIAAGSLGDVAYISHFPVT